VTIGLIVGAVAGYFGGRTDHLLVKLVEIFQTPPSFVLLVVLVAIAQPAISTVIVAIALVTWPSAARLVRAEFRALREKDFVRAARGLGYGHARIIFREILPNALPPLIVTASVLVATAILMESALSFLGLSDPNVVSWGSMIGAGRELLRTAWFLSAVPGVAIVLTVLALNFLGDALNDALNPRLSAER
jgi:peptide/nickel transport system permease protein